MTVLSLFGQVINSAGFSKGHTTTHQYCQNRPRLYQQLVKTRLHRRRTLDKTQAPCPGNHQNNVHRSLRCSNRHQVSASSSGPASTLQSENPTTAFPTLHQPP